MLGKELSLTGVLTKTCERCDGTGEIVEEREAQLDELSDAQVKTLLHADMYRETGGEEAQQQRQRAKRMQQQTDSGPTSRPTNKAGRGALNRGP